MAIWVRMAFVGVAVMTASLVISPAAFETNDDPVMALILSGNGLSEQPTAEAPWINIVLGKLLAALYSKRPHVPWYGALQIVSISVGIAALSATAMIGLPNVRGAVAMWIVLTCMIPYMISYMQFTATAGFCAAAGIAGLLVGACRPTDFGLPARVVATLSLLIGAIWRFDCLLLTLALSIPLAATGPIRECWRARTAGPAPPLTLAARWQWLIAALAMAFALQGIHHVHYASQVGWDAFFRKKRLQQEFLDNQRAPWNEQTEAAFVEQGWTALEYALLESWCLANADAFSTEKLAAILQAIPAEQKRRNVMDALIRLAQIPKTRTSFWIAATLGLTLWSMRQSFRGFATACGTLAVAFGIAMALLTVKKLPDRVCFVIAAAVCCSAVGSIALFATDRGRVMSGGSFGWKRFVALALPAAMLAIVVQGKLYFSEERRLSIADLRDDLAAFQRLPRRIVVVWGDRFPFQAIHPFDSSLELRGMQWISLGWPYDMPTTAASLTSLQIDDVLRAMRERPDLLTICDAEQANLYVRFAAERHGVESAAEEVFHGKTFAAYQFRTMPPTPHSTGRRSSASCADTPQPTQRR